MTVVAPIDNGSGNSTSGNTPKTPAPTNSAPRPRRRKEGSGGGGGYRPSNGNALNFAELIALARHVGFSQSEAVVMAAIAKAESGGRVNIDNAGLNSDGSVDYGLWQINSSHGYDPHKLTSDPLYNARAAFKVFKEQGLGAWATYGGGNGAFTKFLPQARQAAPHVSQVDIQQVVGRNYVSPATASGASPTNTQLTKADIKASLGELGIPAGLINQNASLRQAFNKILGMGLDLNTSVGQARAKAIFENTDWWQTHSESQRKYQAMKYEDPAKLQQMERDALASVKNSAAQMGVNLKPELLSKLANRSIRLGLTDDEVRAAIAGHFDYQKGQAYQGQAGLDIEGLNQFASDYYVRLNPDRTESMVQRMLAGGLDPNAVKDYFVQQAIARFPHLQKQLSGGMTMGDIAAPYLGAMSQILEVAPTSVKPNDSTVMKALQASDGKGGFQLMPEWQFEDLLRQDPRWLKTNNARDTLLNAGHAILNSFGLVS